MSAIENYKIEFVQRTKDLLDSNFSDFKDKDKEVTFLLNCLLGLKVNVSENKKKFNLIFENKIDNEFLAKIPNKIGFLIKNLKESELSNISLIEIKTTIGHKDALKDYKKLWFINKLRNGIAHQNIEGINENKKWIGLKLWNTNNGIIDFEIIFTIEELKNLALKIAIDYLDGNKSIIPNKKKKYLSTILCSLYLKLYTKFNF